MKVLTIFGTRPEIIRLSLVMRALDDSCEHITAHTGQNYHSGLSDVFFEQMRIRKPDRELGISEPSVGAQIGRILEAAERLIDETRPDRLLVLGDTNSALSAFIAARKGVPVFHIEAGNRCYDDRVPEEVNRRMIDHASTILMPYTQRSKDNLVREGIDRERIFVTGNPIKEVLDEYSGEISASDALGRLQVTSGDYFVATIHRAENVNGRERLASIFEGLERVADEFGHTVLVSVHPRTADKLNKAGIRNDPGKVRLLDPLGLFDFVRLEREALAVLTDSGTVQEECAIFGVPNVTVRDVTERPETIECGSNILSGADPETIVGSVRIALKNRGDWTAPPEYLTRNVSGTVTKIVLGRTSIRSHS